MIESKHKPTKTHWAIEDGFNSAIYGKITIVVLENKLQMV